MLRKLRTRQKKWFSYKKKRVWNNNCTVHVNERNQDKSKSNVTFKLTMRFVVQFSPQTMQWYQ